MRLQLAPNVYAAASAIIEMNAPACTVRTGTAEVPRPETSAMRTPVDADAGSPDRATRSATRVRAPPVSSVRAPRAARTAGINAPSTSTTTRARPPITRTPASIATPGSGSGSRAAPIGVSGDAATATAAAINAPATAVARTGSTAPSVRVPGVAPSARSVGWSAEAVRIWRAIVCPIRRINVIASAAANAASAATSGPSAFRTMACRPVSSAKNGGVSTGPASGWDFLSSATFAWKASSEFMAGTN